MTGQHSQRRNKLLGWFRLLAGFGAVQIVIQAVGFLSGILIVRNLSKPDYAWFTIANSLAATMGMLADSGVSGALSSIGGRVWQDNVRFGSLIRTALQLRRTLAWGSITVVTPVFIWMLMRNQAPAGVIVVLLPAALSGFLLQLTASVLGVVISLRQEIRQMQGIGLAAALLRIVLIGIAVLVFIDARVAVIIGTLATGLQLYLVRKWTRAAVDCTAPPTSEYRVEILSVVKRQAPLTIFYCLQAQIGVWLISLFGSSQRVAEIGALGRFAVIFALIASVTNGIVLPRFARCQDRGILRRRYWQTIGGCTCIFGLLVAASAFFPRPLLWILGSQYANLEHEVWLMMLNAAMGAMFMTMYGLTFSKAWIPSALVTIPMEILTQAILIFTLDISTVRGVLVLGCLSCVPPILLNIYIARRELGKTEAAHAENPPSPQT